VNVVRALSGVGISAPVAGMAAGHTGKAVLGLLVDEGINVTATISTGETRSCLTVVADDSTTVFNESGPHIDDSAWSRFRTAVDSWLPAGSVFVCSGSWPPGSPDDAAAQLVRLAAERDCATLCDTSQTNLAAALTVNPDVVKPNLGEALALLKGGRPESVDLELGLERAVDAAKRLAERGPRAVVVSAGASGAVLATEGRTVEFPSPHVNVRNPVGAGDSLVAGIADATARGESLEESVRWGIAMAAASCETLAAGELDHERAKELYARSSAI
jgi:tagatose 6-phosphate kinase